MIIESFLLVSAVVVKLFLDDGGVIVISFAAVLDIAVNLLDISFNIITSIIPIKFNYFIITKKNVSVIRSVLI